MYHFFQNDIYHFIETHQSPARPRGVWCVYVDGKTDIDIDIDIEIETEIFLDTASVEIEDRHRDRDRDKHRDFVENHICLVCKYLDRSI